MSCQHIPQSHGDGGSEHFTSCKIFAAYRHIRHAHDDITRAGGAHMGPYANMI